VPIVFRCPACDRRLSIATRKAGTSIACPNCHAASVVPGTPAESQEEPARGFRTVILTAGLALVLFGGLALALTFALRKPAAPEQAKVEPPPPPAPAAPQPLPKPPAPPDTPQPQTLPEPVPNLPQPVVASQSPSQQPAPQPQAQPQPKSQPVAQVPAPKQSLPLDKFGNPTGPSAGLAQDGEFRGKKLLFWCAFENAGNVFFHPSSPLWKALEAKGFAVALRFGKFDPAWLKGVDQLWVVSSGKMELPAGVTPDLLVDAVGLLPAEAVPSGFTLPEYQYIVRATLDVAFSPRHAMDEKAYRAIEDFAKAGKGLCLLADDEPFTAEADELARRLFGARVGGNYVADKVAVVRGRGLTPAEVKKFGGQFEVGDHALLTGVNFLFEGITISHVTKSDRLAAALKASDGKTLVAVSKVPGQRVVIDCGFTRYCHGPTERTSYVLKTPGTIRLAQNIAAYLAGKDAPKP
jgi:hypothetical protein